MHKPESILEHETHKTLWDIKIESDYSTRQDYWTRRKKTNQVDNFSMEHPVKINESEKIDKYLDLARELKKLWNMKVTVIPIVIGALGIVTREQEKN